MYGLPICAYTYAVSIAWVLALCAALLLMFWAAPARALGRPSFAVDGKGYFEILIVPSADRKLVTVLGHALSSENVSVSDLTSDDQLVRATYYSVRDLLSERRIVENESVAFDPRAESPKSLGRWHWLLRCRADRAIFRHKAAADIQRGGLAAVHECDTRLDRLTHVKLLELDPASHDIGAQLSPRRADAMRESEDNQDNPEKRKEGGGPGGSGIAAIGINRAPLGAKVAASIVLAVLAAGVLVNTYITADDLSASRKVLLYLCGLVLFAAGFSLWMGSF